MRAAVRAVLAFAVLAVPAQGAAQYAEVARALPAPVSTAFGYTTGGYFTSAAQIGRRLFLAGLFTELRGPAAGAVVVTPGGAVVLGAFPQFQGTVTQILPDGAGGWFVVGDFIEAGGRSTAGLARVTPARTLDTRFHVVADGPVRKIAIAHGRVYLVGDFTVVQGVPRRGLAALDIGTGQLAAWGEGFSPGAASAWPSTSPNDISASSIGVYVGALGRLWGLEAASGRLWFSRSTYFTGMAASSARVYLGGAGYRRPIRAVDPVTGVDTDWSPRLPFEYIQATYGLDGTQVTSLLLDGGRLYAAGRLRTSDGRQSLVALDAETGAGLDWRPAAPGPSGSPNAALFTIGPYLVAMFGGDVAGAGMRVYDAATAATVPFLPAVAGGIGAVAPAPEGAVLGGRLTSVSGAARSGLASLNLDTFEIEPWTTPFSAPIFDHVAELATDGQWLFARTGRDFTPATVRVAKIAADSGAIVAERAFASAVTRMRLAGSEIVVGTYDSTRGETELGLLTVADWSYRPLAAGIPGAALSVDADASAVYVAAGGALLAFDRVTGAPRPWHPRPNGRVNAVRVAAGQVWIAGAFDQVGGQRRRGLAALDPASGAASSWNPDVSGMISGDSIAAGVEALEVGPDGLLYASVATSTDPTLHGVAAGQVTPTTLAYSMASGRRLPWRPALQGMVAVTPDCFLAAVGCFPATDAAPSDLHVALAGANVTLSWTLPSSTARTGVRLEFGRTEGRADLLTVDLPAGQQSFTAAALPGSYFARVRGVAGDRTTHTTADVSFAVPSPDAPAAPLDLTARVVRNQVAFAWQPPSTGAPPQYELEAGTAPGLGDIGVLSVSGTATSFTLDNLPLGRFWVRLRSTRTGLRSNATSDVVVDVAPRFSCSASPPLNLAATVTGRVVSFTWDPPADGSEDPPTLVAGTGPGLADIGSLAMPAFATSFAIAAPPGSYYVRLVAGCLTAAASNEVHVVVP